MFVEDDKTKTWHYRCDECHKDTEIKNHHDSPESLAEWQVEGYTNVHICPPCQTAGKTPK